MAAFRILARVSCACFARMPIAPGLRAAVGLMAVSDLFVSVRFNGIRRSPLGALRYSAPSSYSPYHAQRNALQSHVLRRRLIRNSCGDAAPQHSDGYRETAG